MEGWDRAKGGNIKEKNPITAGASDNWKKENIVVLRTIIVTKFKRNIDIRVLLSSDIADEEFLFTNLFFHCFSCFLSIFGPLWALSDPLKPSF